MRTYPQTIPCRNMSLSCLAPTLNLVHPDWQPHLSTALLAHLDHRLSARLESGETVYPPNPDILRALYDTGPADVKVVILGQDPYHGAGEACGLAFAVRRGIRIPPSLRNIYRELEDSLDILLPAHGDLSAWSRQGVLLLNTVLTVAADQAASHRSLGWQTLTDQLVQAVSSAPGARVFLLWGKDAHAKRHLVDDRRHLVLCAPHPSPLSAWRGFMGCGHFRQANDWLAEQGRLPVNWALEE